MAVSMSACGARPPVAFVETRHRLEIPNASPIDLRIRLQGEHAAAERRYVDAAASTLRTYSDWLGPLPYSTLTIVDPPWRSSPAPVTDSVLLDRTPWWNTRATLGPEIATVRGLSRRLWGDALGRSALPAALVDGLAEYSVRRIVAPMFEAANNPPGYAFLEQRYFGGFVPYFMRVRLRPESDGDPLSAYRVGPIIAIDAAARSGANAASRIAKAGLALGTLERWLGRPVFDEIIAAVVRSAQNGPVTLEDFERTASAVGGQDLSWFFEQTFRSSEIIDYGIARLTSDRDADGGYLTTLVARRYGEAVFPGRSAPRVGPFESGRGLVIRMTFAAGQPAIDYWDGRDREKTFRYHTAVPALAAEIDPGRIILLDINRTNNSASLTPLGSTAATRWAARYLNWVANVMLGYAALV
jgi:hypothetical protein